MSTTDAQLGRAIVALRSLHSGSSWRYRGTRRFWRYRGTRRFPDHEILDLFGITKETMKRCMAAYDAPRSWSQHQVMVGVLQFAIKHGRWPTRPDLMKWKDNGLPNKDALHRNFPPRYGRWGETNSTSMEVCIERLIQGHWSKFTPQMILAIPNVTVRQQTMERYGIRKLLRNMNAKAFQEDEFGKLWRLPTDNQVDAHAQWVEVINATAEKNGRRLHFFLRVPPNFNTAKEAVHWTFPDLEREQITAEELKIAQAS